MALLQGKFKPKNPDKYKGDHTNIWYRSGWELKVMIYFDNHSQIVEWSNEEEFIPYRCPTDNRIHRYFYDFKIKDINNNVTLIEVKPFNQTQPPKNHSNQKKLLTETLTYAKNQAKWQAARKYCQKNNWQFKILTEYELGLKKRKISNE